MWPFKKRAAPPPAHSAQTSEKVVEATAAAGRQVFCCVVFESNGERALQRLTEFFDLVKAAKDSDEPADESKLSAYLTEGERSYFSNLTAEEAAEWNEYWFSTPLPKRHSPEMPTPQWDFGSMLDAFWNGDYDLVAIRAQETRHALEFNPHGYPYGGTGSLVALVECFGHRVVGVDDGTGYEEYVPRTNIWKPRASRVV
ncbi:hypothetical protein HI806_01905 [Ralstonia solanacearum]|uniref:hypothetical protein n=1 Tax=Ralstonia pseudosolanacearum TaxID=1310165 RepID=UPI000A6D54D0|nr:hypothetical protein [Ralstonia pseudosolanacearum]QKL70117.1 hypothetical protein HI806_01905 [Ralstonia solanacearum]QKL75330.1 hypothetical protein HI805_01905 [Ralstonia solanacearum]QKL80531.1 hypothetical protein HI804_01910 [Ralstonia solanacearum]QKL85744.1 hypothetical protein HI803_01910 [Ralstonia solanacearum]QKM01109.1 hypothetical protein HI800_01910 [Ralstonia solanacearum]